MKSTPTLTFAQNTLSLNARRHHIVITFCLLRPPTTTLRVQQMMHAGMHFNSIAMINHMYCCRGNAASQSTMTACSITSHYLLCAGSQFLVIKQMRRLVIVDLLFHLRFCILMLNQFLEVINNTAPSLPRRTSRRFLFQYNTMAFLTSATVSGLEVVLAWFFVSVISCAFKCE